MGRLQSRKWNFTKEGAEEGTEHRIWEGGEEGAELADHAQGQHEGGPVLDHSATAHLQRSREVHPEVLQQHRCPPRESLTHSTTDVTKYELVPLLDHIQWCSGTTPKSEDQTIWGAGD